MASEVDICNSALSKIGVERITSLAENTRQAVLCNAQYSLNRDKLLYSHPWNFAIKRAELVLNVAEPEFEFQYAYDLPSDCLRVFDSEVKGQFWQVENGLLLTNESVMKVRYIAKVTNTALFSAAFTELLALKLAVDLSYVLVQSATLSQSLQAMYERALRDARSFDGQENPSYDLIDDIYINSRY